MTPPPNRPAYGQRTTSVRQGTSYTPPSTSAYGTATGGTQVRCTILWDTASQAYTVQVPYDENFREFLKAKIPGPQRAWDPTAKLWRIESGWEQMLIVLATELWGAGSVVFHSRQEIEQEQAQLAQAQREAFMSALPPKERACFEFFDLCSVDALRAAFRKMSTELHPDKNGGDAERMTKLNVAWTALEQEMTKK